LAKKLDALLEVLDATADSLAAACDQRDTLEGGDCAPTIQ
jgi:hypothetical protein